MSFTVCRLANALRCLLEVDLGLCLGCEAASSLAMQVSWLIFEPRVSKIALKASWKQEAFISQQRLIPCVSVIIRGYV